MEEKRKRSCCKGQEVILAQVCSREQSNFHVIDLKAGKIRKTPVASLLNEYGLGSTVQVGSSIYNVGSDTTVSADYDPLSALDHHIHLGASSLDLTKSDALSLLNDCDDDDDEEEEEEYEPFESGSRSIRWKAAPLMHHERLALSCASLGDKIYALGGSAAKSCIGEVFMPQDGWKLLPQPPRDLPVERFCVSSPVIPDENGQRLLVHFSNAHALYAYYPATGIWDCLALNFRRWSPATALVDGVLYSHVRNKEEIHDCLVAYDVSNKSWLKVVYSSYFPVGICISKFVDMLHLGNDMLCLPNTFPFREGDNPHKFKLKFFKFRVKRTITEVLVIPDAVNCFTLKGYLRPIHFIAL